MGMCASQARLLSLTSLKSDTELQVQKINNDREALSRSEEKLMTEYTDKVSNKKLSIRKKSDDGESYKYDKLTAEALFTEGYHIVINGKEYKSYSEMGDSLKVYKKNTTGEENNALQWGIINGTIKLKKEVDTGDKKEWQEVNYASESLILEEYDETDDASAKSLYDLEMKKIQRKDKALELQLDQLETRHKAYETEIESVQKVINSNVENTFNTFGNA